MTHEALTAAVRASELLPPTTAERHGTYAERVGNGYRIREGSRLLAERVVVHVIPGTDGRKIA